MIYLASPYSHPDAAVKEERFQAACKVAAVLMARGLHVYSPIAATHPIALAGELPGDWAYWQEYDHWFVSRCDEVWVLMLRDWEKSKGVSVEIAIAHDLNIFVKFVTEGEIYAGIEEG